MKVYIHFDDVYLVLTEIVRLMVQQFPVNPLSPGIKMHTVNTGVEAAPFYPKTLLKFEGAAYLREHVEKNL